LITGCGLWPPGPQPARVRRIGFLSASPLAPRAVYDAFLDGLRDLGYVDGQNIIVEYRDTEGKSALIPDLAKDLLSLQVEIMVVVPAGAAREVRQVTETLPIVVAYGDPVANGLVASLARPGGHTTGLTAATADLSAKRLQLLKETLPGIQRVAVLSAAGGVDQFVNETEIAAQALGVRVQILRVGDPSELGGAFAAIGSEHADALIVTPGRVLSADGGSLVADLATRWRIPAMFESAVAVRAGGLMAYGPNLADLSRRSAAYVDKILKGRQPTELPVEQPSKFDFALNLQTARALGLAIPTAVLQQATEIIQ
jgi:putative ABC transport system substrate-binding protein